jgi:telomere length regulation protein
MIHHRLRSEDYASYSLFFSELLQSIPSALTQQTIVGSLLSSLNRIMSLDPSSRQRALVKQEAALLHGIVGPLNPRSRELWDNVTAVILNRKWDEGYARVFVCWTAGAGKDALNAEGDISVHLFLDNIGLTFQRSLSSSS